MSIEEYKRLAQDLKKLRVVQIDFTGGEPTISPFLEKIIPLFDPGSNYISISTNGVGPLTEEQLLKYRVLGVDALMISIDSINPKEHDDFRRKQGALSETLKTIALAKKTGLTVFACVVIHHKNLYTKGLEDLLSFTKQNGIVLHFALAVPAGDWSDFENFRKEFMLTKEDKIHVRKIMEGNPHTRFDFSVNIKQWGCPAGAEKIYITPYGDVIPCPFIQISFGNIRQESVIAIRKRMFEENRISQYFNQCLAAEDQEFISKYLTRTFIEKDLPIPHDRIF